MNSKNFLAGLQTLMPYYDRPEGYHYGCEHDQFYAYKTDRPLSEADVAFMVDLGWFQGDIEGGEYDPDEGWTTTM